MDIATKLDEKSVPYFPKISDFRTGPNMISLATWVRHQKDGVWYRSMVFHNFYVTDWDTEPETLKSFRLLEWYKVITQNAYAHMVLSVVPNDLNKTIIPETGKNVFEIDPDQRNEKDRTRNKQWKYIEHYVGAPDGLVQRCILCGEVITDYTHAMVPVGQSLTFWEEGVLYISEGTNPRITTREISAITSFSVKCKIDHRIQHDQSL